MTSAERQRRHRDLVTQTPMTKTEREDLTRLIRNREKVMKTAASQRSAELLAEFEQQLASVYHYDQDEIWKVAFEAAEDAVEAARAAGVARSRELGIPDRFAPDIGVRCVQSAPRRVARRRQEPHRRNREGRLHAD